MACDKVDTKQVDQSGHRLPFKFAPAERRLEQTGMVSLPPFPTLPNPTLPRPPFCPETFLGPPPDRPRTPKNCPLRCSGKPSKPSPLRGTAEAARASVCNYLETHEAPQQKEQAIRVPSRNTTEGEAWRSSWQRCPRLKPCCFED